MPLRSQRKTNRIRLDRARSRRRCAAYFCRQVERRAVHPSTRAGHLIRLQVPRVADHLLQREPRQTQPIRGRPSGHASVVDSMRLHHRHVPLRQRARSRSDVATVQVRHRRQLRTHRHCDQHQRNQDCSGTSQRLLCHGLTFKARSLERSQQDSIVFGRRHRRRLR